MFDLDTLVAQLKATLIEPDVAACVDKAWRESYDMDYKDVWLCYQIASGDVPQYPAVCDFFGIEYEGRPRWIWNDIYSKADLLMDTLSEELAHDLPPGCHFSIGHWKVGGPYGVILGYDHLNDSRDFHTVRFVLKDWQRLQRLNWALDDARTAARAAALGNHAARVHEHREDMKHFLTQILDIMEGYLV